MAEELMSGGMAAKDRLAMLIGLLAQTRQQEERLVGVLDEALAKLEASEQAQQVRQTREKLAHVREERDTWMKDIREVGEQVYAATGNKEPVVGVKIKLMTGLTYDAEAARAWAFEHLPQALDLNTKLFEKHAKAVVKTDPVPGVEIVEAPQVTIASDLSGYLEK